MTRRDIASADRRTARAFTKAAVGARDRVFLLFNTMCLFAGETYVVFVNCSY